jgi:hypothetical protein
MDEQNLHNMFYKELMLADMCLKWCSAARKKAVTGRP